MSALDSWLNQAYKEKISHKSDDLMPNFKKSMAADATLKSEANKRLAELKSLNAARGEPCAFSKVHREFLMEALNG